METYLEMLERHKSEIIEFQDGCHHEKTSEMWVYNFTMSQRLVVCLICNKVLVRDKAIERNRSASQPSQTRGPVVAMGL